MHRERRMFKEKKSFNGQFIIYRDHDPSLLPPQAPTYQPLSLAFLYKLTVCLSVVYTQWL